jgi:predicted metal-binding protein
MEKRGIINCRETSKKCSGKGCKKTFKERKDAFARYQLKEVKLVRFVNCRGCGENAVTGIIKEAEKMEKRGVKTIHLSSCMKLICIWHDEFVFELSKKFEVVDFTHGSEE